MANSSDSESHYPRETAPATGPTVPRRSVKVFNSYLSGLDALAQAAAARPRVSRPVLGSQLSGQQNLAHSVPAPSSLFQQALDSAIAEYELGYLPESDEEEPSSSPSI